MPELSEDQVVEALQSAFVPAEKPAAESARPPEPDEQEPVAAEGEEAAPVEGEEGEQKEAAPVQEPEFEIEVNGQREVVKGKDQIRELLQKGRDYSQKSEFNARARDALAAQAQQIRMEQEFSRVVFDDIAQLRAMDAQLEHYNRIDWSAAIDSDFTNALKLQEQRNSLREARAAKAQEIAGKQQTFQQGQAQAAQQKIAAEGAALLAKVPEWRNSETRAKEQQSITKGLADVYGFNEAEISGLQDHRMVLVARDAMKWRALQANKADKIGQVRSAPPVVKPGPPQNKERESAKNDLKIIREAGRKNDHRAQEKALERMLNRAFK